MPGVHERSFDFHRMIAKRFPYSIYYKVASEFVENYAVLDSRRDTACDSKHSDETLMDINVRYFAAGAFSFVIKNFATLP